MISKIIVRDIVITPLHNYYRNPGYVYTTKYYLMSLYPHFLSNCYSYFYFSPYYNPWKWPASLIDLMARL